MKRSYEKESADVYEYKILFIRQYLDLSSIIM